MRRVIVNESQIRKAIRRLLAEQSGPEGNPDFLLSLSKEAIAADRRNAYRLINYIFFSRTHPPSAMSDKKVEIIPNQVEPIVSTKLGKYNTYSNLLDSGDLDGSYLEPLVANFFMITLGPSFKAPTGESFPTDLFVSNFGKVLPAYGWSLTLEDAVFFIRRIIEGQDIRKVQNFEPTPFQLSSPGETLTVTAPASGASSPAPRFNINEKVLEMMVEAGAAANSEIKIRADELNSVVNRIEPLATIIIDHMRAPFGISGADTGLVPDILRPDELKSIARTLIRAYDDPANFQGQRSPQATCFAIVNGVNLVYGKNATSFLSSLGGIAVFSIAGLLIGPLIVPGNRFYRVFNMGADAGANIRAQQVLNKGHIEEIDKSLAGLRGSEAYTNFKNAVDGTRKADEILASITEKGAIKSTLDDLGIPEDQFTPALAAARSQADTVADYEKARQEYQAILTRETLIAKDALLKTEAGKPTAAKIMRMNREAARAAREAFKQSSSESQYKMLFDDLGNMKSRPAFDKPRYQALEKVATEKATAAGKEASAAGTRALAQADLDKLKYVDPDGTVYTGQSAYDEIQKAISDLERQKNEKIALATSLENKLAQIDKPASLKPGYYDAFVEYAGAALLGGKGPGFYFGRLVSSCILSVIGSAALTLSAFVTDPSIFSEEERTLLQLFLAAGMNRSSTYAFEEGSAQMVSNLIPKKNHLSDMALDWSRKKLSTYGDPIDEDPEAKIRYGELAGAISDFAIKAANIESGGVDDTTVNNLRTVFQNVDKKQEK